MKDLLNTLIKTSSIKLSTQNVIKQFIESPHSHSNIKSSVNAYAIFNDYYYKIYEKIYDKLPSFTSRQDLRLFLDILVLNYKIEEKDIIDPSDVYLFPRLQSLSSTLELHTYKINSFCHGHYEKYKLANETANKYKLYDLLRRMRILRFNFCQIFKIYNPYRYEQLNEEEKVSLDFLLNAIYPNIISILDSFAFIMQFEFNIIPNINLKSARDLVKLSLFSKEFSQALKGTPINNFEKWFNDIKQLRHTMIHRMPFYNVQILGVEETKLFQQKYEELTRLEIESLCAIDKIKEEYEFAIDNEQENVDEIYKKLDETIKKSDKKVIAKHNEMIALGQFTGIFTDDVEEKHLHHISRILLDIQKMFLTIDIVLDYIAERKTI